MKNQHNDYQIYRKYLAQMSQVYNQREDIRMFVELLLTLSAIFVFSVFAIRPTLTTIGGLSQEINQKKETIATMDQKIENLQTAQQAMQDNAPLLPFLLKAVPGDPEVPTQIQQFENIAHENGVTITAMTLHAVPVKGDSLLEPGEKSLPYSLVLEGTFQNLMATVKTIENMLRPSLFMTTTLAIGDEGLLSLSISGEVPYLVTGNTPQ